MAVVREPLVCLMKLMDGWNLRRPSKERRGRGRCQPLSAPTPIACHRSLLISSLFLSAFLTLLSQHSALNTRREALFHDSPRETQSLCSDPPTDISYRLQQNKKEIDSKRPYTQPNQITHARLPNRTIYE